MFSCRYDPLLHYQVAIQSCLAKRQQTDLFLFVWRTCRKIKKVLKMKEKELTQWLPQQRISWLVHRKQTVRPAQEDSVHRQNQRGLCLFMITLWNLLGYLRAGLTQQLRVLIPHWDLQTSATVTLHQIHNCSLGVHFSKDQIMRRFQLIPN